MQESIKKMRYYALLVFAVFAINIKAQIGVGEWRDHFPYINGIRVAVAGEKVYCATESSLFYFDKSDNSVNKISKVHGLSDVGLSTIAYNNEYDLLLVAYSNANIDIISGQTIYNISDIKRKQITGYKTINSILFVGKYAYLSCGFGIVVVDIENKEIKETYIIGDNASQINVFELTRDNQFFYAATEKGIFKADINNQFLVNYANWTHFDNAPQANKKYTSIAYFNNNLYALYDDDEYAKDTIFVFDGNNWSFLDTSLFKNIESLSVSNDYLIVSKTYGITTINTKGDSAYYYNGVTPLHGEFDADNKLWFADKYYGLRKARSSTGFDNYFPNGPYSTDVVNMAVEGSNLYAVAGGVNGSWSNLWNNAEINIFINEEWKTYKSGSYKDIVSVVVDPSNPSKAYAGSWNYGIIEFDDGNFVKVYNESNSTLQSVIPGAPYIKIGGMAFDSDNNLWVSVSGAQECVSVMLTDGTWYGFNYGSLFNNFVMSDIIVTKYNHKWIILPRGGGIFAFDDKGTFDDISDDDTKEFSILDETGKLITSDVYSMAEDLEGDIWIGTNKGVLVYYDPENVFDGDNFYAQKIIIEMDGNTQYLLETETVTAIEVDGANRKWIGTQNSGVFLMSEDGTEQILNFNIDNSPLISNKITSIAIDGKTGEVFFGTDKGIVSYKAVATDGDNDFNKVYVYPNPVRPEYTGLITITGLVANANVKITDITGNIVYEVTAEGGQAVWDGNDFNGNRVKTGVYLAFCSNEDGSKTHVTKILFIN